MPLFFPVSIIYASFRLVARRREKWSCQRRVGHTYTGRVMKNELRTARFNMMVTPTEKAMLGELSVRFGLTESDVLRQYIRKAHEELFGEQTAASASKPKRAKK
jgi:hypothetical protein